MTNDNNIVQLSPDKIKFSTIDEALTALAAGSFVVVADDEGRENEGDLICAASLITPQMVNFMAREARGLICVALTAARAKELDLRPMVENNTENQNTAFTVSVDAGPEFGVTTGISAADRATTIQRLVSPIATAKDFRYPGHIFPLIAQEGGTLRRVGHTEAAVDLARLAGVAPMGVICEIMNDDGAMARRDDLAAFAKKHGLPFITIAQLIAWRMERERFVMRKVRTKLNTQYGAFTAIGYQDMQSGVEHLALIKGPMEMLTDSTPLVRVQHENIVLDVLGSNEDPSINNLGQSLRFIEQQGSGVVVYLRSANGASQSLLGTLQSYAHEEKIMTRVMDLRDYGVGAQILNDLGITRFRLVSNSPKKIVALRGFGLEVVDSVPLPHSAATHRFDFAAPEAPSFAAAVNEEPVPQFEQPPMIEKTAAEKPVIKPVAAPVEKTEAKDAPVKSEQPKTITMRMGAQVVSNQTLFEG